MIMRDYLTNSNSKTTLFNAVAVTIFHLSPVLVISIVGVDAKAAFLSMNPTPSFPRKSSYFSSEALLRMN